MSDFWYGFLLGYAACIASVPVGLFLLAVTFTAINKRSDRLISEPQTSYDTAPKS